MILGLGEAKPLFEGRSLVEFAQHEKRMEFFFAMKKDSFFLKFIKNIISVSMV